MIERPDNGTNQIAIIIIPSNQPTGLSVVLLLLFLGDFFTHILLYVQPYHLLIPFQTM